MGYMERIKAAMALRGWGMLLTEAKWFTGIELKPVDAKIAPDAFSLKTNKGLLSGARGDVIVRFANGDITVIDAATWPLIQVRPLAPEEPVLTVKAQGKVID